MRKRIDGRTQEIRIRAEIELHISGAGDAAGHHCLPVAESAASGECFDKARARRRLRRLADWRVRGVIAFRVAAGRWEIARTDRHGSRNGLVDKFWVDVSQGVDER